MAAIRENILINAGVRDAFLDGVTALDAELPGLRASDLAQFLTNNNLPLGMSGIEQDISTYDLFVFWHVIAMSLPLPPGNAAHSGPIFLPWHRMFMIRLEQEFQRVLGDPDFGLPYWDWAEDGELAPVQQWQATLWTDDWLGESRGRVRTGAMGNLRVRLAQDAFTGELVSVTPRQLERAAGLSSLSPSLPTKDDVVGARDQTVYDQSPWSQSVSGHRNVLEGWVDGPQLHNRVHVWIGGDMGPGTSPNDPVFFLNHCNVDRIWEAWMSQNGPVYAPGAGDGPAGHRLDSAMAALLGAALTPADVLDPAQWYAYDTLSVA